LRFASGATLKHMVSGRTEALADPDDITDLNGSIYVAFQNGVGPQGQASTTGNLDSTVVELNAAGAAVHYRYDKSPLPHGGGTDAVSIDGGMILISASAPGTSGAAAPQAGDPAVYRVTFDAATQIASVKPLFFDEDFAQEANLTSPQYGQMEHLYLTDPDSNEVVPSFAARFGGDLMLTSQGDEEQIFVSGAGTAHQALSVLQLSASVDDTAWPANATGSLYAVSTGLDTIERVSGRFTRGAPVVSITPCDESSAPATCPGPGYAPSSLGRLNPRTGLITSLHVSGPPVRPQGLLFLP
jgi:hypothetical protein